MNSLFTFGILASQSRFDPAAQAYFFAAGITDNTEKVAWNDFVLSAKANGYYSKFYSLYPLMGGTANQQKWDAVRLTAGTFAGGMTHNADGITGNGTNSSFDTGLAANSGSFVNDLAFGAYNRTSGTDIVPIIGATGGGTQFSIYPKFSDNNYYYDNTDTPGRLSGACGTGQELGLCSSTRTASNSVEAYTRSTILASSSNGQGSLPSGNFMLLSLSGSSSLRNICFAYISEGLTSAEISDLYTDTQTLQTSLGRAV